MVDLRFAPASCSYYVRQIECFALSVVKVLPQQ